MKLKPELYSLFRIAIIIRLVKAKRGKMINPEALLIAE